MNAFSLTCSNIPLAKVLLCSTMIPHILLVSHHRTATLLRRKTSKKANVVVSTREKSDPQESADISMRSLRAVSMTIVQIIALVVINSHGKKNVSRARSYNIQENKIQVPKSLSCEYKVTIVFSYGVVQCAYMGVVSNICSFL